MARKKKVEDEVKELEEFEELDVEESLSSSDKQSKPEKKISALEDLPGVGPATAEKLREAGYDTIEAIAVASPLELKEIAGISEGAALKIIQAAREAANIGTFMRADEYMKRRTTIGKISTGSKASTSSWAAALRRRPSRRYSVSSAVESASQRTPRSTTRTIR